MNPCKRDNLCRQCAALRAECGDDLFEHYRRKPLIRGWATFKSPAERAYIRAHSNHPAAVARRNDDAASSQSYTEAESA